MIMNQSFHVSIQALSIVPLIPYPFLLAPLFNAANAHSINGSLIYWHIAALDACPRPHGAHAVWAHLFIHSFLPIA